MKSQDLGLPIFYQDYPQFFDNPNDTYATAKNNVVTSILRDHDVKTVLDMTCGTGAQTIHLSKYGFDLTFTSSGNTIRL